MAGIDNTSLHDFIYMCILQASSVSTTTCIDHHVFMVSFLSEMNYFATLVGLFFRWKKLTNKTPNNLFHPSEISVWTFYLMCFYLMCVLIPGG